MQIHLLCDCCGRKIYEDDELHKDYGVCYCKDCWNFMEELRNDNSGEPTEDQREDSEYTD